jgi:hypothetical protein
LVGRVKSCGVTFFVLGENLLLPFLQWVYKRL